MQGDDNFQTDRTKRGDSAAEKIGEGLIGVPLDDPTDLDAADQTVSTARDTVCAACRQPLSKIFLNVDGNTLIMESCDGCDIRRWQLAGKRIDLKRALEEVGDHVSRARS